MKTKLGIGLAIVLSAYSSAAHAEGFAGVASAAGGFASFGSNDAVAVKRSVLSGLVRVLPGYGFGKWIVGPSAEFRFVGQLTSVEKANNTLWSGSGPLVGVGALYQLKPDLYLQAAVSFLGSYTFTGKTAFGEKISLNKPMGIRASAGWQPWGAQSPWGVDGGLEYVSYSELHSGGTIETRKSSLFGVNVGISYLFGARPTSQASAERVSYEAENTRATKPVVPRKSVYVVQPVRGGLSILVNSDVSFEDGSAQFRRGVETAYHNTAKRLAAWKAKPIVRVTYDGDSSEGAARADLVVRTLADGGLPRENVFMQQANAGELAAKGEPGSEITIQVSKAAKGNGSANPQQ